MTTVIDASKIPPHAGNQLFKEMIMARQIGLAGRHRSKDGEISRKKGNTRVDSLRKTYGDGFAEGYRGDMHLQTLLEREHVDSLDQLLRKRR
jgi:hypothetical protein